MVLPKILALSMDYGRRCARACHANLAAVAPHDPVMFPDSPEQNEGLETGLWGAARLAWRPARRIMHGLPIRTRGSDTLKNVVRAHPAAVLLSCPAVGRSPVRLEGREGRSLLMLAGQIPCNVRSRLHTSSTEGAIRISRFLYIPFWVTPGYLTRVYGQQYTRLRPYWTRVCVLHACPRCIMASPLVAGNDLRHMSAQTIAILTNPHAIAVNRAPRHAAFSWPTFVPGVAHVIQTIRDSHRRAGVALTLCRIGQLSRISLVNFQEFRTSTHEYPEGYRKRKIKLRLRLGCTPYLYIRPG